MSKEIPDFNPGRVDTDVNDDLGDEILDDGYGNNEAGSILDEETGEPLKTIKELALDGDGNESVSDAKNRSSEVVDDKSPKEKA